MTNQFDRQSIIEALTPQSDGLLILSPRSLRQDLSLLNLIEYFRSSSKSWPGSKVLLDEKKLIAFIDQLFQKQFPLCFRWIENLKEKAFYKLLDCDLKQTQELIQTSFKTQSIKENSSQIQNKDLKTINILHKKVHLLLLVRENESEHVSQQIQMAKTNYQQLEIQEIYWK